MFTDFEKLTLLKIARESIESELTGTITARSPLPFFSQVTNFGAFVTLREKEEFRGCIGYTESAKSLVETIEEVSKKSAFDDPRFEPVSINELPTLTIEISVLSPLKSITNIEELEVGTHGILLTRGSHRGLLLPQVAVDHGWNRLTFLEHASRKASLPPDGWRHPESRISIFTAEVFCESKIATVDV